MINARLIGVVRYVGVRGCQCTTLGGAGLKKVRRRRTKFRKAEVRQYSIRNKRENASAMVATSCIRFYFLNASRKLC